MYQKYKSAELVKPSGLELKDRLVGVQRVTKVTKGGRAFGFSAIVVVGDEAGVVGHGLGKSKDVASAIAKAIEDAKKNLVRIPLNKATLPLLLKLADSCNKTINTKNIFTMEECELLYDFLDFLYFHCSDEQIFDTTDYRNNTKLYTQKKLITIDGGPHTLWW